MSMDMDAEEIEALAEKVHVRWMERRISDGWKFGHKLDDEQMFHPYLVPYDQLPDSEKEYDRATVQETLTNLHDLGYKISKENQDS